MCGRFAQFHSRDEFIAALQPKTPLLTTGDWHARYNVAPGKAGGYLLSHFAASPHWA